MITVSYNDYCAISKEDDNDIWTVRPRGVVPLLPLYSEIDVGATVNALLGDTFSRENNTHGSRFHDQEPISRSGSTICFTNFGSHDPVVLYWNPWYTELCYKGSLLYLCFSLKSSYIEQLELIKTLSNVSRYYIEDSSYEDQYRSNFQFFSKIVTNDNP